MLVTIYQRAVLTNAVLGACANIYEAHGEIYIFILGFLTQHAHHFFYWVSDVECLNIVSELVAFDLGEV